MSKDPAQVVAEVRDALRRGAAMIDPSAPIIPPGTPGSPFRDVSGSMPRPPED